MFFYILDAQLYPHRYVFSSLLCNIKIFEKSNYFVNRSTNSANWLLLLNISSTGQFSRSKQVIARE